ncbi:hypothetical protein K438DRAFT_1931052 [Mycena galopus ATCC 62051]|nr:hypothetical protein K438DRAFT_1931052 [Mycena galopus ATCC 62051]
MTGVIDTEYGETVADLALISTSTGSLVISHLPYSNGGISDINASESITEKQVAGPVHSWFSSCGCLASVPDRNMTPPRTVALSSESSFALCFTMGSLSRYRGLSAKGENTKHLKLGSIYLQRPGEKEVHLPIAELQVPNTEAIIEDWTTRKGDQGEAVPPGWTRVYMPIAERERQRAVWLLQAHSILQRSDVLKSGWSYEDMVIGERRFFCRPSRTGGADRLTAELFFVNLDWQLFPALETLDHRQLPQRLFVFVKDISVDSDGYISNPTTFWSVHPDGCVTGVTSVFMDMEECFTARGSGRSWEAHHYMAAWARQKDDEVTLPSAEASGLPQYQVSPFGIPEK